MIHFSVINKTQQYTIYFALIAVTFLVPSNAMAQSFRHRERVEQSPFPTPEDKQIILEEDSVSIVNSELAEPLFAEFKSMTAEEIFDGINGAPVDVVGTARYYAPQIFSGFRPLRVKRVEIDPIKFALSTYPIINEETFHPGILKANQEFEEENDSLATDIEIEDMADALAIDSIIEAKHQELLRRVRNQISPDWYRNAVMAQRIHDDLAYNLMIRKPATIDFAYWNLPEPPTLPDDVQSFRKMLASYNLTPSNKAGLKGSRLRVDHINWLHELGGGIQMSQAYLSPNWYQGGNNSLALLINLGWTVTLNPIWHPNVLLSSDLNYKLGVISTPQDKYHKYAVSQDLLQWNFKSGFKAFSHWFYSFTTQFKTQIFHQYPQDSRNLASSWLSPGDLNLGLGMTYSITNKKKTFKFNASIAPISYNLKTCIDPKVEHTQFGVKANRKFANEVGSNAELNLEWKLRNNISYKSRMFLFSDYTYFQGDWENTLSFNFNKFLSTQIYWNLRYDSSADSKQKGWKNWMIKEILSFGFSYYFTTKAK